MVIIFGEGKPRRQLLEVGAVTTFRTGERKRTRRDRAQETWATDNRGGSKLTDVHVAHLTSATAAPQALQPWVHLSGFESVEEWLDAIEAVHGDRSPTGHIYLVTLRGEQ